MGNLSIFLVVRFLSSETWKFLSYRSSTCLVRVTPSILYYLWPLRRVSFSIFFFFKDVCMYSLVHVHSGKHTHTHTHTHTQYFSVFYWIYFVDILNIMPFVGFPSRNLLSHPPPSASMSVLPHPTTHTLPPPQPNILLYWGVEPW